jgi:RND family efflux transporter MFP subunit
MAEGWVVPNSTVNVTIVPGAQGRIVALNANVGDYVTKGQVLADLDTSDHVDDFTAAEAAADSQRAKLSLVEHPYRPEEIEAKRLQVVSDKAAVGIAASHLSVLKQGARPQQLAQARAAVTAAKAQLQLAAADAAREKQLLDKDLVPKAEYDQAATALAVAQGHVDETQAALSLLQEGARTEEIHAAQLALQQARITCREDAAAYRLMLQGSRPEAIRQAAADYMASSSMAHKQALMLSHHQVFAPITGIIVARNVNVGEYATADATRSVSGAPLANNGRSLFVIADAASAQFSASIDQRFFHNIHVGMPVQIGLEAYPGVNFPGHITQVTPLIQPSSTKAASTSVDLSAPLTFTVRATFNASRFRAVPGQVGLLTLSSKQKNLVVPQSAVTAFSVGQGVVYVVHNHTVHAQSVQYDASSDGDLHVTKGLKDGDQVVISDPTKLQDGMHVQIVPATTENYNSKAF